MRKEPVDQLTVIAEPLNTMTIAGQDDVLPHGPSPQGHPESGRHRAQDVGPYKARACPWAEGRLTGTWLIQDAYFGV